MRLSRFSIALGLVCALFAATQARASTMYKCVTNGQVTYANEPCKGQTMQVVKGNDTADGKAAESRRNVGNGAIRLALGETATNRGVAASKSADTVFVQVACCEVTHVIGTRTTVPCITHAALLAELHGTEVAGQADVGLAAAAPARFVVQSVSFTPDSDLVVSRIHPDSRLKLEDRLQAVA